jgi:hypothetical protein
MTSHPISLAVVGLLFIIGAAACHPAPSLIPKTPYQAPVSATTGADTEATHVGTQLPATASANSPVLALTAPIETEVTKTPSPLSPTTPAPSIYAPSGIEIHSLAGVDLVQQAGVYWVRRNALLWSLVEPVEGERNWEKVAPLEKELVSLSDKGLHLILIIRGTPLWAQKVPGYYCGQIAADKFDAFGQFLFDAVSRYSAPPYNVQYFELWNEPDVPPGAVPPDMVYGCWGEPDSLNYGGEFYGRMLQTVYPKIKAANPDAKVILGGLLLDCDPDHPPETTKGSGVRKDCISSRFLSGVLESGGGASFDGLSFHSYDYYNRGLGKYSNYNWGSAYSTSGPSLIAKVQYLLSVLDRYGVSDKFLMNTESALICGSTGKEDFCLNEDYQATKAIYAVEALAAGGSVGLQANIWYSLNGWRGSELVDSDGNTLPAYEALQFYARLMPESIYLSQDDFYQDVPIQRYRYSANQSTVWILWSKEELDHEIHLEASPKAVYDIFGNSLPAESRQVVGIFPIYIVWEGLR